MPAVPRRPKTPPKRTALERMPQVGAMPTDVVSMGNAMRDFLAQHRFSFANTPQIGLASQDEMVDPGTGVIPPGGSMPLALTYPDGRVRVSPALAGMGVNGQSAVRMLHEMLHTTVSGRNPSGATRDQALATEQATETETQDLLPGVLHYLRIDPNSGGGMAYGRQVMAERYASARATGTKWTSPEARAWRAQQFLTAPDQRRLVTYT